jgi:gamma-glutamyltranspeptidase / glutathione hydrolase
MSKGGAPVMSFGVMGGTMQPQGDVQLVVRIADYGQNPQAACDGPRFRWVQGLQVSVEGGFPPADLAGLRERGHQLVAVDDYNQFGSCQAIWRLDDGYVAASDPRRAGGWGVAGVLAAVVPGSTHTSRSRHPLMTTSGRE